MTPATGADAGSPGPADASQRLRSLEEEARQGRLSSVDALTFFDSLPAVAVEAMTGSWRGAELSTGHPLDGLLGPLGWHGKRFDGPDDVHPLVFEDARGLFSVNPAAVPITAVTRFPRAAHAPGLAAVGRRALRSLTTTKPRARLRMMQYRGVVSGAMVYDALPINDHFRRVDADTMVGVMDLRGLDQPFLFVLRREGAPS